MCVQYFGMHNLGYVQCCTRAIMYSWCCVVHTVCRCLFVLLQWEAFVFVLLESKTKFHTRKIKYIVLSCTVSHPVVWYRIVSYPFISYGILSCNIVSFGIVSYRIVPYPTVWYGAVQYRTVFYPILAYPIVSYHTVSSRNIPATAERSLHFAFSHVTNTRSSCKTSVTPCSQRHSGGTSPPRSHNPQIFFFPEFS